MSPLILTLLLLSSISCIYSKPPNIIILLADDVGYGDLPVYGHPTMTAPNLDKMAEEGLVFKQFYSTSPVCSPSRASILTGRYQTRSGVTSLFFPQSTKGLPLNETTLAEGLKSVGYYSAIIGKWHLGVGKKFEYLPTNQGFDYYFGIPYSHDMCPCSKCFYPDVNCSNSCLPSDTPCPIFSNTEIVQQPADFLNVTNAYVSNAKDVITKAADKSTPFFLFMAFQHTHDPQFAGKEFTGTSIRGGYGDAMNELDWAVGEIFETLKRVRAERDTFVFFTSDNGPSLIREINGGSAGLLRCGKGTTWEGGQRVPAIAWWPKRIKPGKTLQISSSLDIFPTVMKIANADLPDVTLDGVDLSPLLFDGQTLADSKPFMHYSSGPSPDKGVYAVRWKQYKAHYYSDGGLCGDNFPDAVCRTSYGSHKYDPPLLYNLNHDPSEIYPLDTTKPPYADVLAQMTKLKSDFDRTMVWGPDQIDSFDDSAQPCAQPGCSPFPQCCTTDSIHYVHPQNMSWAIA